MLLNILSSWRIQVTHWLLASFEFWAPCGVLNFLPTLGIVQAKVWACRAPRAQGKARSCVRRLFAEEIEGCWQGEHL